MGSILLVATPFLAAFIALLVGLRVGQRLTRKVVLGALVVVAAWFILISALSRFQYPDPNAILSARLQSLGGPLVWLVIYATCGFSGPALFSRRAVAAITSILITIAMATVGTFALIYAACAFGHDCL